MTSMRVPTAVLAALALLAFGGPGSAQSPTSATGSDANDSWSATIDGVRGRLLATAIDAAGTAQLRLECELENVREAANPIEINWGTLSEDVLQMTVENEAGVALPQLHPGGNRRGVDPFWLEIPDGSSIRFTISRAAFEYMPGRVWLRPLTFIAWEVPTDGKAKYYMRGKLTPRASTDREHRPWAGPLLLPRIPLPPPNHALEPAAHLKKA